MDRRWRAAAFAATTALCADLARAQDATSATATLVPERGLIVVNVAFGDEADRQSSITVSCDAGQASTPAIQSTRGRYASFEVQIAGTCVSPIVHIVETHSAANGKTQNEFHLVPSRSPLSSAPAPYPPWWNVVAPVLITAIATILATIVGARLTERREQRKARFDLIRPAIERELAACRTLAKLCEQLPALPNFQNTYQSLEEDLAPNSPVMAAFQKLQKEARVAGGVNEGIAGAFLEVLKERQAALTKAI
ncbi:MAG: hypothetical protein WDO68_02020 [Gammaproteobacteria bacterium]